MSILIPVVETGVTLTEIPNRISFYIMLGNCKQKCKGCHSSYLWAGNPCRKATKEELETEALNAIDTGADAIVVMGGTTNGLNDFELIHFLRGLVNTGVPVGLYSGSDDEDNDKDIAVASGLTWLKTGDYRAGRGGLDSKETNQRFYLIERRYYQDRNTNSIEHADVFHDKTYWFQK